MNHSRWWMHRDQKMDDSTRCYQSSVYFEDCVRECDDSFICCPGSHMWENGPDWVTSANRDHVSVPHEDPKVREHLCKLVIKKGEMIIWNSKLAHMGGYITKSKVIPVSMKRLAERSHEDIENIKNDLETHGVALVKDVVTSEQMKDIYAQFCRDVSKIYDISASERVFDNPDFVFGRQNKGGGAWAPISCTKAAWDARLLPRRLEIFKKLLEDDDLCVGIDSLHINNRHNRFCSMASFSPKRERSESALKRKCLAQALGIIRTTHWAHRGNYSKFGFGTDRNRKPQERFERVSKSWRGHGCVKVPEHILESVRAAYVKTHSQVLTKIADSLTLTDAKSMVTEEVLQFL